MQSMNLFMFLLFLVSFVFALKSSSNGDEGLLLRLFQFALGALSVLAGMYFAMLYYGPFGNPGSLSRLFFPVIALMPCVLGSASAHWLAKPEPALPTQKSNG